MHRIVPLLFLLAFGCRDSGERTNTSKSNPPPGQIEHHLRGTEVPAENGVTSVPVAASEPAVPVVAPAPRAPAPPVVPPAGRRPEAVVEAVAEPPPAEAVAEVVAGDGTPELESNVQLVRVVVASGVEAREPVGSAPFAPGVERVFLYVEARNDGGPGTISVRWVQPDGTVLPSIELEIPPSRRWRTWATTTRVRSRAGAWTAIVTDAAGRELARESFVVAESPSA